MSKTKKLESLFEVTAMNFISKNSPQNFLLLPPKAGPKNTPFHQNKAKENNKEEKKNEEETISGKMSLEFFLSRNLIKTTFEC